MNVVLFSNTDTKLLIALCNEMTSTEVCNSAGISYPYAIKRLSHLYKQGWLSRRQEGKEYYYLTKLTPATEHFFELTKNQMSNTKVARLYNYYGQNPTVVEAIQQEALQTERLKGGGSNFPRFVGYVLNTLRRRSYRAAQGELTTQPPDEQTMREWLEQYIKQTQRNLKLAEEIYNNHKLWEGSPTTWKWIATEPPGETANQQANYLLEIYRGVK